ncbi:hypothetical protein [Escherichia phage PMBT57]|uniref:DNA-directed RNA polymerase n=1 Tax=Escherichia phage PMBT57 TaxID=2079259 RepID=A0A2K9VA52_9CAUD|nr:hypothetical protein [Escherichia phage PMBT57]
MQTFTAREYLKIDIANNYGLDKEDWDDRIAWFDKNENNLLNLVREAEEPALFYAGVKAWMDVKEGKPIGYPVALDATSSGLQILACLTGDRRAAELCNVVNYRDESGKVKRRDAYTVIYNKMLNTLGKGARIKRNDCKQAIMTALYGSEAKPKEVFGEGIMLNVFESTMNVEAPAVWELNKFWLQCGNPEAFVYHWVMPDGFNVYIKVMVNEVETVHFLDKPYDCVRKVQGTEEKTRMLSANTTHSIDGLVVRELVRRCDYDKNQIEYIKALCNGEAEYKASEKNYGKAMELWGYYEKTGFLTARIFDYLDSETIKLVNTQDILDLIESMPKKPFHVLTVHDCFRCLPNYGNDIRRQYNNLLATIAKGDLLSFIMSQVLGQEVTIGKLDPTLWEDVLETEYALS